jgi:hypothetical protein
VRQVFDDLLELKPGKPGGEHILPDAGLEPGADPIPEITLGLG